MLAGVGIERRDERRAEGRGINIGGALSMNDGTRRDRGGAGRDHRKERVGRGNDFVQWSAEGWTYREPDSHNDT